jgi:hypothetical protein
VAAEGSTRAVANARSTPVQNFQTSYAGSIPVARSESSSGVLTGRTPIRPPNPVPRVYRAGAAMPWADDLTSSTAAVWPRLVSTAVVSLRVPICGSLFWQKESRIYQVHAAEDTRSCLTSDPPTTLTEMRSLSGRWQSAPPARPWGRARCGCVDWSRLSAHVGWWPAE